MSQTAKPRRLPVRYIHKTQETCQACLEGLDTMEHRKQHTCAYGNELYIDSGVGFFSTYSHKTDHMCPSHGGNWVHVGRMSRPDDEGNWTSECGCGWQGSPTPSRADADGSEHRHAAHQFRAHQDNFCTCYYEKNHEAPMTMTERMAHKQNLPFVEIPMALVFETMKNCDACQNYVSELEGDHTCMLASGELDSLMHLNNKLCPTHLTSKGDDGYEHYIGHLAKMREVGSPADHYACQCCEYKTPSFENMEGNIIATRHMVMHRMSHCTCQMVDIKTWNIKNTNSG